MAKQNFIKVGDKMVPVDRVENGVPIIKATSEQIDRGNGRIDCVVHVPCLQIKAKSQNQKG